MMRRRSEAASQPHQDGFTLIELMIAMMVGMILTTALTSLFMDFVRQADGMINMAQLNSQAREMFDTLALGAYRKNVNVCNVTGGGTRVNNPTEINFNYVFGIRGRNAAGSGNDNGFALPQNLMARATNGTLLYQMALSPASQKPETYADQSPVVLSESISPVTLTCTGTNQPVFGCNGTATVSGFFRMDSATNTNGLVPVSPQPVVGVALDLINPVYYERSQLMEADLTSVYWTAFTNLVTIVPTLDLSVCP